MHLTLTNKAKEKIVSYATEMKKENQAIRIGFQGGCCGGNSYTMDFAKEPESYEVTLEANGIKIFIDEDLSKDIEIMKVDYLSDGSQHGFKITTPGKKKEGCCGKGCCG